MLPGYVSSILPRRQPLMARQSYAHEIITYSTLPAAVAMLEGGVVGVLAKLVFEVSDFGFATIIAAPMFANLTSLIWARVAHGRAKVPVLTALQMAMLLIVAGIALLPTDGLGPAMLVAMVVLGRCLWAGAVAIRTTIWRANYRRSARAGVTSRFLLITTLIVGVAPLLGYTLLDVQPWTFRLVYPAAAAVGAIGAAAMMRVRVRRERHLLKYEQTHADDAPDDDDAPRQANGRRHTFASILREDRHFRGYMTWQFLAGVANMMGNTAMMLVITEMATHYDTNKFFISILFNSSIPMLLMALCMPWWAKLLDRWHVAEYRCVHGTLWIVSQLGNFMTAASGILWLVAVPRAAQGIAQGGGMLAWNLGHHDFAERRLAQLYMGIHQTLTGIRGIAAPYIGVLLLSGWQARTIAGASVPGWEGIGEYVFLITAGLACASWLGFLTLAWSIRRERTDTSSAAGARA